jgi:hypothetical protein
MRDPEALKERIPVDKDGVLGEFRWVVGTRSGPWAGNECMDCHTNT